MNMGKKLYDLFTPLVKDVKMEIKYEQAKEYVLNGLQPLGTEYNEILKEGFKNRWIDVWNLVCEYCCSQFPGRKNRKFY